jgi:hypothetical protein
MSVQGDLKDNKQALPKEIKNKSWHGGICTWVFLLHLTSKDFLLVT